MSARSQTKEPTETGDESRLDWLCKSGNELPTWCSLIVWFEMGNRMERARCSDGNVPMPQITGAPPPANPPPVEQAQELPNPGTFEELGKKVKEQLFPQCFDGAKVVITKGLSKHFQTMHTLTLGSSMQPSQWAFGATYVGSQKVGQNDFRPVMMGDMSNNGSFTALLLHQVGRAWRLKCNVQTQKSRWVGYQATLDYIGSDFTASFTAANPDILDASGTFVLQYIQSLTTRLSLGTELLYQKAGPNQTALLSLGGQYQGSDWEASARVGMHAWQLAYHQRLKDLVLMAECEGSLLQGESTAAVGYQLEVGGVTMRGKVDTHACVSAVLEKRLDPLPATLLLSGQLNHWTDESRFGIALLVG